MRNCLISAALASGMLFAFAASAQTNDPMYTTGTGDSMMVMGGTMGATGMPVAKSQDQCKEGGFYMSGDKMVTACGEGGMSYELSAPESGAMMAGNKPYPEGSMMMNEHKM